MNHKYFCYRTLCLYVKKAGVTTILIVNCLINIFCYGTENVNQTQYPTNPQPEKQQSGNKIGEIMLAGAALATGAGLLRSFEHKKNTIAAPVTTQFNASPLFMTPQSSAPQQFERQQFGSLQQLEQQPFAVQQLGPQQFGPPQQLSAPPISTKPTPQPTHHKHHSGESRGDKIGCGILGGVDDFLTYV